MRALHQGGVRIPDDALLVVIVVGDEGGENGEQLAAVFRQLGYRVDALALIDCSQGYRGHTVRQCSAALSLPFSEISVTQFDDPYQVPRVLKAIMEAPAASGFGGQTAWVEKVMQTPLLEKGVLA